jgi:aromatic ring-opening dioxygenase catalytic subunit (LigB family)
MEQRQPVIFLPHGAGPCFFMDWNPPGTWDGLSQWLQMIPTFLPQTPEAIVVITAHWEEKDFSLSSNPNPDLYFDYYGFPPQTYELLYEAPGNPDLAGRISAMLSRRGMSSRHDANRGWDHGTFIPLKMIFPDADIPVVQMSLKEGLDPEEHFKLGEALELLRSRNVLIIGSGMSYHNMHGFGNSSATAGSRVFTTWMSDVCMSGSVERRRELLNWKKAPYAKDCHPREEHLLPLMVCAGAAGKSPGRVDFQEEILGVCLTGIVFSDFSV